MAKAPTQAAAKRGTAAETAPPRVLIEDWLPAAAIGVECMREHSLGKNSFPPTTRLHVWWARRPLILSRAAVLGSLLPADFNRSAFDRLMSFGCPPAELIRLRDIMDSGVTVKGGFGCGRAYQNPVDLDALDDARQAMNGLWGEYFTVLDPMAGGGSIPLESARLGLTTLASEYNPVACSILEATIDYPFRLGEQLVVKARKWARVWLQRVEQRLAAFYPEYKAGLVHAYILARTVPCPDTGFETPLVTDWHLLKPKGGQHVVAVPVVDRAKGTWHVQIKPIGGGAGMIKQAPRPSYANGKGVSLFSGQMVDGQWHGRQIPPDYIKVMAQQHRLGACLYAVALKTAQGLRFLSPSAEDMHATTRAADELARLMPAWQKAGVVPSEEIPPGDKTGDTNAGGTDVPLARGELYWIDLFTPRQLLCNGVLVEELQRLRREIIADVGENAGAAVIHLLGLVIDKVVNHNCNATRWENTRAAIKGKMDRHDYAFKATFAEYAVVKAGAGLEWAANDVIAAYAGIADLSRAEKADAVSISMGSAVSLPQVADQTITAVVVDPPYDYNVQYCEMSNFFYVWLKRTIGWRRPEWFATRLCDYDQEAVVNVSRHRAPGAGRPKRGQRGGETAVAQQKARTFYQKIMTDAFRECRRVLRDDGVLTIMFTHKKQDAWEALFSSLIHAGFRISATWPVKTESEKSLHQARKNAAQSTVILVARKRPAGAGVGYFDHTMESEIRERARGTAERLRSEGLNAVDQLVGSFGPAMEVYSRYDEVRTDTGQPVGVDKAIDLASDAVSKWRIEQLAARGLDGVEAEGQFYLLCWDVLGAAEFRFNEARLLGHAVGMDVDQLVAAGLVSKSGDKIMILSAKERRRDRALEQDQVEELLFGRVTVPKRQKKKDVLKVHPNDPRFRTALDACHALALRWAETGGGKGGIGNAKALARQQNWTPDSNVARLMQALVNAAPEAVKFEKGKKSAAALFPEFRAWHALLPELFGIESPEWKEKEAARGLFSQRLDGMEDEEPEDEADEEAEDEAEGEE